MRRLIHLMLSPSCRLARLMVGEKRVACDAVIAEDLKQIMPIFVDMDGTRAEGVWAILDHLEHNYPDYPLAPADDTARREVLPWSKRLIRDEARGCRRHFLFELQCLRFSQRAPINSSRKSNERGYEERCFHMNRYR